MLFRSHDRAVNIFRIIQLVVVGVFEVEPHKGYVLACYPLLCDGFEQFGCCGTSVGDDSVVVCPPPIATFIMPCYQVGFQGVGAISNGVLDTLHGEHTMCDGINREWGAVTFKGLVSEGPSTERVAFSTAPARTMRDGTAYKQKL